MLGSIVFYTFNEADNQARGALPQNTYPALVVQDHGDDVYTLVVFTSVWHDPTYVRPQVSNGTVGQLGTWNAAAA